jgi:hypothetical protein
VRFGKTLFLALDARRKNALDNVYPRNNYTVEQKLDVSIEMAKALADLHGYEGGVDIRVIVPHKSMRSWPLSSLFATI